MSVYSLNLHCIDPLLPLDLPCAERSHNSPRDTLSICIFRKRYSGAKPIAVTLAAGYSPGRHLYRTLACSSEAADIHGYGFFCLIFYPCVFGARLNIYVLFFAYGNVGMEF